MYFSKYFVAMFVSWLDAEGPVIYDANVLKQVSTPFFTR